MQPQSPNPGPGRTLQSAVAPIAHPVLDAYEEICDGSQDEELTAISAAVNCSLPANWLSPSGHSSSRSQDLALAAQALLSVRLVAETSTDFPGGTIHDAGRWFVGDTKNDFLALLDLPWFQDPPGLARALEQDDDLYAFLPYIFEVFDTGPVATSRASVHSRRNNRRLKRKRGVFYTPPDVAEYMAQEVVEAGEWPDLVNDPPTCLDPACGTGVLLRAFYEELVRDRRLNGLSEAADLIHRSLFGIDLSPSAVASSSFVLLAACVHGVDQIDCAPLMAWNLIRENLRVGDSTKLFQGAKTVGRDAEAASGPIVSQQANFKFASGDRDRASDDGEGPTESAQVGLSFDGSTVRAESANADEEVREFPTHSEMPFEFDCLLTNPPYSTDERANSSPASRAFLPFVEMMWEATAQDGGVAGIVVPLSISYNSGPSYRGLRKSMKNDAGRWRTAFFDRAPDSLFGDDVKTRNAILFLKRETRQEGLKSHLSTTSLLRWNSRSRDQLFSSIRFTPISWPPHDKFIPKIGSRFGRRLYETLQGRPAFLKQSWHTSGDAQVGEEPRSLFLGRTAYNWLPAYWALPDGSAREVRSDLWSVSAYSQIEAEAMYGICASRLVYWLWRVEGDGFHLNKGFVERIPLALSDLRKEQVEDLAAAAMRFWNHVSTNEVRSTNKGRSTISYAPHLNSNEQLELDKCIESAFGLPPSTAEFVQHFAETLVAAGRDVSELTGGTVSHQGR